jgi:hypothetical protein
MFFADAVKCSISELAALSLLSRMAENGAAMAPTSPSNLPSPMIASSAAIVVSDSSSGSSRGAINGGTAASYRPRALRVARRDCPSSVWLCQSRSSNLIGGQDESGPDLSIAMDTPYRWLSV